MGTRVHAQERDHRRVIKERKTLIVIYGSIPFMPQDDETTVSDLKIKVKQFCDARDWDQYHGAKDLAIGVTTESAELLEIFRFKSQGEIDTMFKMPESREKITDEMADVLFFLMRMAQKYDIDIADAFHTKMIKNERKYTVEKARGSNKKYDEF